MTAAAERRPLLVEVVEHAPTVRITLEVGGQRFVGVDTVEPGGDDGSLAAGGARAALDALAQATPGAVDLRLDWCEIAVPGGRLPRLAVVLVTATIAGVPLQASGSVLVRDRPDWAGARAVLQALNRRLEIMSL